MSRQQRHLRDPGHHWREELADGIEERKAAAGDDRIGDEGMAQQPPADQIANSVHDEAGNRRRKMQPMLQQQGHAEDTALGDAGEGVDIIKAKG